MSHTLFRDSSFCNARVWAFLKRVDEAEAEACRAAGCSLCGGDLHSATYPRKPHGLAPALRDDARRFSFCCAACRRRATPPSCRFFGRRFRVAPLFLLVSALVVAGGVRLEAVGRQWGIPVLTLRRWRRWWQETFPDTRPWRWKRGELAVRSGEAPLVVLLRSVRGECGLRSDLVGIHAHGHRAARGTGAFTVLAALDVAPVVRAWRRSGPPRHRDRGRRRGSESAPRRRAAAGNARFGGDFFTL